MSTMLNVQVRHGTTVQASTSRFNTLVQQDWSTLRSLAPLNFAKRHRCLNAMLELVDQKKDKLLSDPEIGLSLDVFKVVLKPDLDERVEGLPKKYGP